jgi:hypothetical protein
MRNRAYEGLKLPIYKTAYCLSTVYLMNNTHSNLSRLAYKDIKLPCWNKLSNKKRDIDQVGIKIGANRYGCHARSQFGLVLFAGYAVAGGRINDVQIYPLFTPIK